MKQTLAVVLNLILICAAAGVAQAQQLPNPVVQRPGAARAGRAQNSIENPLVDQPQSVPRAGRGKPASDKPVDQPADRANELPKLTAQQQKVTNAVIRHYIVQVQQKVGLTDAQADKVSDGLQNFLHRSMLLAFQRQEITDNLQKLTDQKGSPEEFQAMNERFNTNKLLQRRAEDNFYNQFNPDLTPEQQGRLRLFMSQMAQQIHQAIQDSRQQ
jgi:hypothetical protein